MSRKTSARQFVIEEEAPGVCALCQKRAETRPYGPGGAEVCFSCGMLDEEEAQRRFAARVTGPVERPDA